MHIKDANLNETYLTKENKITLVGSNEQEGYGVYVSTIENLNDAELKVVSSMPDNEVAKIDSTAEIQNKKPWWKFWKKGV